MSSRICLVLLFFSPLWSFAIVQQPIKALNFAKFCGRFMAEWMGEGRPLREEELRAVPCISPRCPGPLHFAVRRAVLQQQQQQQRETEMRRPFSSLSSPSVTLTPHDSSFAGTIITITIQGRRRWFQALTFPDHRSLPPQTFFFPLFTSLSVFSYSSTLLAIDSASAVRSSLASGFSFSLKVESPLHSSPS